MDILNYFSWIKRKDYREKLPTDTVNLLPVGAVQNARDDKYLSLAINANPLHSLYDKGAVTQQSSITKAVNANFRNGIITTVPATLSAGGIANAVFTVNNTYVKSTSTILVSLRYGPKAGGTPYIFVQSVNDGSFEIKMVNLHPTVALGAPLNIHFMIIE